MATAAEQKKTEKQDTREYTIFVEVDMGTGPDPEDEGGPAWEMVEEKYTAKSDKEAIAAYVATLNEEQASGRFFAISRFTIHTLKVEQKLAWA